MIKWLPLTCLVGMTLILSFTTNKSIKISNVGIGDTIQKDQQFTINRMVGVDQFGRTFSPIASYREDKKVGLFFWLWIGQPYATGIYDATTIGQKENGLKLLYDFRSLDEKISPNGQAHYWGEPLWGYYNSIDEWVIRKQLRMLTQAGVDYIVFDATNHVTYFNVYQKVLSVIEEFQQEGWNPPRVVFYTHSRSMATVKKLYEELYSKNLYPSSWYRINNKPVIIAYQDVEDDNAEAKGRGDSKYSATPYSSDITAFFHFEYPQWPSDPVHDKGFPWVEWTFPQPLHGSMMNVSVASHPLIPMSQSLTRGNLNWGRGYDPYLKKNIKEDVDKGTFFQHQWDHVFKVNPDNVFIGGWNEWVGYKQPYDGEYMLCDAADKEFSRDIEPMKGGYEDAFYLQMIANIRKYKGAEKNSPLKGTFATINPKGNLSQWEVVKNEYLNIGQKNIARNEFGGAKTIRYEQAAIENAILGVKVCHDNNNIYFNIRMQHAIAPSAGKQNWMNVLLGTGTPSRQGWEGYNFEIGRNVKGNKISIGRLQADYAFQQIGYATFKQQGNHLQITVPRVLVGLNDQFKEFYFKVADGVQHPNDIMDYYLTGSVLPMGRLSYLYPLN